MSRSVTFVAVVALVLAFELWVIFVGRIGVSSCEPGRSRQRVEVSGGTVLAQTFGVTADGFSSVTLATGPAAGATHGDVVFELLQTVGRDPARTVLHLVVPARAVVAHPRYRLEFPPIDTPKDTTYRLDIRMPGVSDGDGVAFAASREAGCYPGGSLFVNEIEQWGDLAFETRARSDTVFGALERGLAGAPRWLRSRWSLGVLAAFYNLALGVFVYGMLTPAESTRANVS